MSIFDICAVLVVVFAAWHAFLAQFLALCELILNLDSAFIHLVSGMENKYSSSECSNLNFMYVRNFMVFRALKWNESGFRPPLCTYRINWARRTSWGWWDDWDDTVLQTQDSKFEPWRSEAEHATSRSRRLPTILTFTRGWGRNIFCFFQTAETGNWTPNSGVKGSGVNHYPRAPALRALINQSTLYVLIKHNLTCLMRRLTFSTLWFSHLGTHIIFNRYKYMWIYIEIHD